MGKVMVVDEDSPMEDHLYLPSTLRKPTRPSQQRTKEILLNCGSDYIVLREEDVPYVHQPRVRRQQPNQSFYAAGAAPVLGGTPLSNASSDLVVPVGWPPGVLSSRIADVVSQGGSVPKGKRKGAGVGDSLKSPSERSSNVGSHDQLSPVISALEGAPALNEDNCGVDSCCRSVGFGFSVLFLLVGGC